MSFLNIFTKLFRDPNQGVINKLKPLVEKINTLEPESEKLSNEELGDKMGQLKNEMIALSQDSKKELNIVLPRVFALVREAAKRTLGERHFDVQLMGGIVLHQGQIAEMKTGEGKTLVATLPASLNALAGKGVHIVTVNDYLAKRDTEWMGPIYYLLGFTVGCIVHEAAYLYDPGYQAGIQNSKFKIDKRNELGDTVGGLKVFENYLRPCSRKEAYGADIVYGTNNEFGFDYLRDNMVVDLEEMVQRELNYAIIDEIDSILIDEARTPLIISAPAEESADTYYQFAQLIKQLKEGEDYNIDEKMKAATLTEAGIKKMEKWLKIDNIYTAGHINLIHHLEQALKAQTLFKRDRDYVIKNDEVIIVDEFTGRLMFGRRYSEGLHQAIEAKEGVKIQKESRTLATVTFQNYFRLYQKLAGMTGTAVTEAEEFSKIYGLEVVVIPTHKPMIRADLSDRIYKTEKGKFKAAIEEIKERHKKSQPVLIGTISIEKNELLSEMLFKENLPHNVLNAKNHEKEAAIISGAGRPGAITVATNMAGRGVDIILGGQPPPKIQNPKSKIQNDNSKTKIMTLDNEYEKWQEEHNKVVALGGLHIIGTERHESRRIDNQLRGRAGRQGDPGSSQFYVSLEDDLMRIFGGERVKNLMERLGVPEDLPIENKMVSRSLEAAQKKIEGHNFDLRKHLLEYDDVLNKHREVIYKKRKEILLLDADRGGLDADRTGTKKANTLREYIIEMVEQEIDEIILFHTSSEDPKDWNIEEIYEVINTIFPLPLESRLKMEEIEMEGGKKIQNLARRTKIIQYLVELSKKAYQELEEKIKNPDLMRQLQKNILLRSIDALWIEHLEAIDHLRVGIGLRGYGQRDPLIEYKKEAYRLFNELLQLIRKQVSYSIYKITLGMEAVYSVLQRPGVVLSAPTKTMGDSSIKTSSKIGRNDPCPCGSGRKFKKCHGK